MSNGAYYLLWLTAGLVLVAIASAVVARRLRLALQRRLKAAELLDALDRYSDWVAAQRRTAFFQGDIQKDSPLEQVRALRQHWFPELSGEAAELFAVHARLIDFLWGQQQLRQRDPEAWLVGDHEAKFAELWHQHLLSVWAAAAKLELVAGAQLDRPRPGAASPA